MIGSANRHRPRRFFALRGVVRAWGRSSGADVERPCRPSATDAERALQSERARFAAKLDLELRLACRSEATIRRELGEAARTFVRRRAYRRLGFVRLSDYARERLGVSARMLESAAWLATRLDALPAVSRAYGRSELSWTQARAICKVAVATDEEQWLALARQSTVATLERLTARASQPDGVQLDPEGEPNEVDGEPAVRWRFVCPARVRALWRRALDLASRVAGESLSDWRAAEIVAAEAASGRPAGASLGDRALIEAMRLARCDARHARDTKQSDRVESGRVAADPSPPADASMSVAPHVLSDPPPLLDVTAPGDFSAPTDPAAPSDPFALESRLAEAMRVLRTIEPRIGRLLRVVVDQRIYRSFGHATFADYARERLGISARKAWVLLKVEKATVRSADFDRAYRDGRLSWVRAMSLLPVLDRQNGPAWITRAETVTVRRLTDEIEWVLASRDVLGPTAALAPPPIDSPLPSPFRVTAPEPCRDLSAAARVQIRAHGIEAPPQSSSANPRRWRHRPSKSPTPRYDSPDRPPSWRCSATYSMRSRSPTSHAGWGSNACSATSSSIGKARRAITIPCSRVTAGAARSRRAARAGICTTTTFASAPAAATTRATIARRSVRPITCTASTTARSKRSGPPRAGSNGSSVSDSGSRRF
jgi:hypothetical protein